MLSIAKDKIDSLFELIGSKQPLYLPVDNNSGKADFQRWEKGTKLSECLKTTRSAKDFFFPKTEHMVSYELNGKEFYRPSGNGYEVKIKEHMRKIRREAGQPERRADRPES